MGERWFLIRRECSFLPNNIERGADLTTDELSSRRERKLILREVFSSADRGRHSLELFFRIVNQVV